MILQRISSRSASNIRVPPAEHDGGSEAMIYVSVVEKFCSGSRSHDKSMKAQLG